MRTARRLPQVGATIGAVAVFTLSAVAPAGAVWTGDQAGSMSGRATTIPSGPSPTASATGDSVDLSWATTPLADGADPQGYTVSRYSGDGTGQNAGGTCAGTVTVTSCADSGVSEGTWTYRIRIVQHGWTGSEGPPSESITIDGNDPDDTTAPVIDAVVVSKAAGGDTGYIRQASTYYVYASASDPGDPASGVSTLQADASSITPNSTAVTMTPGTYTAGGITYGYRSPLLTAADPLPAGSKTVTVTATDGAGNEATSTSQVVVDNTAPATVDIQTVNGGTAGKPDQGDRLILTYDEPIDAHSILPGWTGSSTAVTVRLSKVANTNVIEVYDAAGTTLTRLGTITISHKYVTQTVTFASSTLTRAGNEVTVTLGVADGTTNSIGSTDTMQWTPAAGGTDRAGNALPTTTRTERGSADVDF